MQEQCMQDPKSSLKTAAVFVGKPPISGLQAKAGAAPLLTIDQAAERCTCSRRLVQSEIKAGHIRVTKIGKRLTRIDARDLDEYLNDRKSGGTRPVYNRRAGPNIAEGEPA
jgi:excisionase family DNA binding protein